MRLIDADEIVYESIDSCDTGRHESYYGTGIVAVRKEDIDALPTIEPELIRCKDCRWWDKYGDYDKGYCMAAKHRYWSKHWEISIMRKYKGNFYCADAEPKGEQA